MQRKEKIVKASMQFLYWGQVRSIRSMKLLALNVIAELN